MVLVKVEVWTYITSNIPNTFTCMYVLVFSFFFFGVFLFPNGMLISPFFFKTSGTCVVGRSETKGEKEVEGKSDKESINDVNHDQLSDIQG